MADTSGKRRPLPFLPLTAAAMLMIGVRLAIHGDVFERICGAGSIVAAALLLIGWILTIYPPAHSHPHARQE